MKMRNGMFASVVVVLVTVGADAAEAPPDFATHVAPLLQKYCLACHDAKEANGEFILDGYERLMKGGEHGAPIVAGDPDKSLLVRLVERKAEPFMPPEGSKVPSAEEIGVLRAWIKAGAKPSKGIASAPTLVTPKVAVKGNVRRAIHAASWSPTNSFVAIGRYGTVEIQSSDGKTLKVLEGHTGRVNDLAVSRDGKLLAVAAGETGLSGEATLWNTATWERAGTLRGHRDSIDAIDLSPDGTLLATGSYDQRITVWDLKTLKPLRNLDGHNGAINDLTFHASGRLLASAGSDRTIKLWDVATGTRLDTLGQPEKEQYAVAFTPDGRYVLGGGVDNRLRVWELTQGGKEGTNPLIYSRFAHEGPILKIVFSLDGKLLLTSGEDRSVKFWETSTFTPQRVSKGQADWPSALALSPDRQTALIGRLDGSLERLSLVDMGVLTAQQASPILKTIVPETPLDTPADKLPETPEAEPNNSVAQATPLAAPAVAQGVLQSADGKNTDVDLYRFEAKKGEVWILETNAARRNSPADTRLAVLDAAGKPVLRHLLQAVRASMIEFRPIDSSQEQVRVKNWEEMEINQFLYMNGEVGKFHRMPEGPDSGFWFYAIGGKRRTWFDTNPTVHAMDDPCYIVEAYPPGTPLVDNGLPVFPLLYENDDDSERKLGSDSRLTFTAPADGVYYVQVTDVRGFGGKEYVYSLSIRRPRPDFNVSIGGKGATVGKGSGQRLTFTVDRVDGFDGDVTLDIEGLPSGFSAATPVVIQGTQVEARGVLNVTAEASAPPKEAWDAVKVRATATVAGKPFTKDLGNLGEIKLADKPKVLVRLELDPAARTGATDGQPVAEIVVTPGRQTSAFVRIERNGAAGDLRFDVDNLPHGVIVDDLGLNGITLLPGQTERRIFISARDWVPETTRLVYAICRSEGNQASVPVLFRVKAERSVAKP